MNENGRKDGSEQSFLFSQSIDTQQGLLTVQASNKGVTAIAFAERLEASQPAHTKPTATAIEPNQVISSEITKNATESKTKRNLTFFFFVNNTERAEHCLTANRLTFVQLIIISLK